jgi:hypothetical protein
MGSKKPYRLKPRVSEQKPDKDPSLQLEVLDYVPPGVRAKKLIGGAYDPYETPIPTGDTVRVQKARTDLRKLSAWIKQKNEVAAMRENETNVTTSVFTRRQKK